MKFQASAFFSIVLYSMKIGGVECNIVVDDKASGTDMVVEIAHKLMGVRNLILNNTIRLIGDSKCSGIFSNGTDAMAHNADYNYTDESNEKRLDDVERRFPESGIVLSTGIANGLDINLRKRQSDHGFGTAGDEYLDAVVLADGLKTKDACILEFEFIAPSDVTDLYFEYLFGSDEYNDYVGDTYHDVFALVLNGENIAIVPNTTDTYVAINTLNKGESGMETGINGENFINNERVRGAEHSAYESFAPNGFTRMLQAVGKVTTGNNKISFRIADVDDNEMDSWVMITAGSLGFDEYTPPPVTSLPTKSPVVLPTESPVASVTESPSAYAKGDPHFMTWAGETYDFHGVCDLVLVHVGTFGEGIGMDIHIRSEKMKMWSFVASVAVRIGQEIFEVIGGREAKFLTNGVEGKLQSNKDGIFLASTISGFPIHRIHESGKFDKFAINLGSNEKIVISTWHSFVSVSFENTRSKTFKDSVGLLGSFSGGLKLARDGTTIIREFNEYGQEWQVRDSEPQLFHNIEGPQYPLKCEIPSSTEMRRRLEESELTMNEAKEACVNANEAEKNLCIFDVLATNNKITSGAY